ncbi:hypothetical protein OG474_22780 [Kribbella sp. NBC_01505]|uniref:hypothetical protein n=1 Tax=Kribbella sp. NBC_01505 TaxID=2903580 RepID=UPI0038669751
MSYPQQPPQFQPDPSQQFQAQQFQAPQSQPQAPTGLLQLTIQGSVMTNSLIPPKVHLNGYLVPVKYGRNDIPVFAGPMHVEIHSQWMMTFGKAALDFTVQPGQAVPVFYASPYHQFSSAGSIGHTKVKRKGLGFLLGLVGGIVALCLLVIILAALN